MAKCTKLSKWNIIIKFFVIKYFNKIFKTGNIRINCEFSTFQLFTNWGREPGYIFETGSDTSEKHI